VAAELGVGPDYLRQAFVKWVGELRKRNVMVVVDGGIRTGFDVLKMLALGADCCLVGRDIVRAAIGGGADGVRLQMEHLQHSLSDAMRMTGVRTLADVSPEILAAVPGS